jgi:hypothetical protein
MGTWGSFRGRRGAEVLNWPHTSKQCRSQENVDLYIHLPLRLHGLVLSWLSMETTSGLRGLQRYRLHLWEVQRVSSAQHRPAGCKLLNACNSSSGEIGHVALLSTRWRDLPPLFCAEHRSLSHRSPHISFGIASLAVHATPSLTVHCTQLSHPLWSTGPNSWLQIQRSRVRFPALPYSMRNSESGTGFTQPCEDNWGAAWMKSSLSGL